MKTIQPDWPAPDNVHAHTTLKQTWGHPDANYKSQETRTRLVETLALPDNPVWLNQVHGDHAVTADFENLDKDADASYTSTPERICVVMTADCIPVLVCNKQGTKVAAIHAGWRGLAAGIIEKTIAIMEMPADDTLVWLGPAIGPEKFEVGKDVYKIFTDQDRGTAQFFKTHKPEKWLADLHSLARAKLMKVGIKGVYTSNYCTFSQTDKFYSYRRDGGKTGRMASLIWIGKPKN